MYCLFVLLSQLSTRVLLVASNLADIMSVISTCQPSLLLFILAFTPTL